MNSLPRWLISITDMPEPCQSSISEAACASTSSGRTAGPALKLKTRVTGLLPIFLVLFLVFLDLTTIELPEHLVGRAHELVTRREGIRPLGCSSPRGLATDQGSGVRTFVCGTKVVRGVVSGPFHRVPICIHSCLRLAYRPLSLGRRRSGRETRLLLVQAPGQVFVEHACNERLVGNALFVRAGLYTHEIGCGKSNVHPTTFHESRTRDLAKRGKLCFAGAHRNQCALFVRSQHFSFVTVKSFHRAHPIPSNRVLPSGSG